MPRLRVLSSQEVIKTLKGFGFEVVLQKGSHIKLTRMTILQKQVLIIPNHKELATGTLKAIFNQAKGGLTRAKMNEKAA